MSLRLHPAAYAATVGDDLVLLDVAQDQYFCLPGEAASFCLEDDLVTLRHCDAGLLEQLLGAGLVTSGAPSLATPRRAPLPAPGLTDLSDDWPLTLGLGDVRRMSAAALRLYRWGYCGSLASMIDAARPVASRPGRRVDGLDLARRCERLLPWIPFQGECLFRSFLTVTALRRAGVDVTWMFGVQTWPFRAHCWLQIDDVVINDAAERVGGYSPIMVA